MLSFANIVSSFSCFDVIPLVLGFDNQALSSNLIFLENYMFPSSIYFSGHLGCSVFTVCFIAKLGKGHTHGFMKITALLAIHLC